MNGAQLASELRARLVAAGDAARAEKQQAYMKSAMPYHGVAQAELTRIAKALIADHAFASAEAWRADVRALWHGATHREERYVALMLAEHRHARMLQGLRATPRAPTLPGSLPLARAALDLYEELIVSGAWWDLVDPLATHHVGALLAEHVAFVAPRMRQWSASDDIWKRRAAIISQLRFGPETDTTLLMDTIEPALDATVFWLRKAIGWALRQYARTDPEWVRATVTALGPRLSGLSRREALKHL